MANGFGVSRFSDIGDQMVEKMPSDEISELPDMDDDGEAIDELPEIEDTEDEIDDLPNVDCEDKLNKEYNNTGDEISEKTGEKDNIEKNRMQPPQKITFKCKDKYDEEEYNRQVKNQEEGMNNLSLYEYKKNREKYKENGRDVENGKEAQERARQEARADRVTQNMEKGMSREEAEKEADEWIESQAALHDPDQVAGGNPENVTGVGDKDINSSIGSQWKAKVDELDEAVDNYIEENNLTEEDQKNTYLNVKLEVEKE